VDGGLSPQDVADEILGMILAGTETSATSATWFLYACAKYPEIQEKVRAEIKAVIGDKVPTYDELESLKYTMSVLLESLRRYCPVQWFTREVANDEVVCGYFIPKGAVVWIAPPLVNWNPNLWENPWEFKPERFTNGDKDMSPCKFASFGAGPRQCIGRFLSYIEVLSFVSVIIRTFKIEFPDEDIVGNFQPGKFQVTRIPALTTLKFTLLKK